MAKGYLARKKMREKRCFCPAHNFQWMVKPWQTYPLPPSPYPMPSLFVPEKLYVTQIFRVGTPTLRCVFLDGILKHRILWALAEGYTRKSVHLLLKQTLNCLPTKRTVLNC